MVASDAVTLSQMTAGEAKVFRAVSTEERNQLGAALAQGCEMLAKEQAAGNRLVDHVGVQGESAL